MSNTDPRFDFQVSGFAYDRDSGEFQIYNPELETIPVDSLQSEPSAFVDSLIMRDNKVLLKDVHTGAAVDGLYLIGMPVLQRFLACPDDEMNKILTETQKVMREVQSEVIGRDLSKEPLNAGFMGYNAQLIREGHPVLHVIGNCACISVDYMGFHFEDSDWDTGYTSWSVHNVDGDQQWASLYAGVGYMAYEAAKN